MFVTVKTEDRELRKQARRIKVIDHATGEEIKGVVSADDIAQWYELRDGTRIKDRPFYFRGVE